MLRELVTSTLNNYLSSYINEISDTDINTSLLRGELFLRNISFSKSFLASLDVNVSVSRISAGYFHIKIPWTDLSNSRILVDIRDLNVILSSIKDNKKNYIDNRDILPIPVANDTYRKKLFAFFMSKLKISITQVHIRWEHRYLSATALGACIDCISLDSLEHSDGLSSICKSLSLVSLSIYLDRQERSDVTCSSSDIHLLLKDVSFRADVHWNLLDVEDRHICLQSLEEMIASSVPTDDRDVLISYFSQKECGLLMPSSTFQSPNQMSERIRNDLQGKLNNELSADIVTSFLFDFLRKHSSKVEAVVEVGDFSINVERDHLCYLSDMMCCFPNLSKRCTNKRLVKNCINFNYYVTFLFYHIVSSSPLLFFSVFTLLSYPFMLISNFRYALSFLLCLFTVFLYGYRYVHYFSSKETEQTVVDNSYRSYYSITVKTGGIFASISDVVPILSFHWDHASCDFLSKANSRSFSGTISSLEMTDCIVDSYLLKSICEKDNSRVSFSADFEEECKVVVNLGASAIQLYQPTICTLLSFIHPMCKESKPKHKISMAMSIFVKSDKIRVECIENDFIHFAMVDFDSLVLSYNSSDGKNELSINSFLYVCDLLTNNVVLSRLDQSDQSTLFSLTYCPETNPLIKLMAPSLKVYLDLPFIQHFVNYIRDGAVFHKEKTIESQLTDYSHGVCYDLSFPESVIILPAYKCKSSVSLHWSQLRFATDERTNFFKKCSLTSTKLLLMDSSNELCTASEGKVIFNYASGKKDTMISFSNPIMNLEEHCVSHILQVIRCLTSKNRNNEHSTDNSDTVKEIERVVSIEMNQLSLFILHKAKIELNMPNVIINSSQAKRTIKCSFESLICKDVVASDWSKYNAAAEIGALQWCMSTLESGNRLICNGCVNNSQVIVTPFLLTLPSLISSVFSDIYSNVDESSCSSEITLSSDTKSIKSTDGMSLFGCKYFAPSLIVDRSISFKMDVSQVSFLLLNSPQEDNAGLMVVVSAEVELESMNASYNAAVKLQNLRIINEKTFSIPDSQYNEILESCSVNAVIQSIKPRTLEVSVSFTPILLTIDSLGLLNISRIFIYYKSWIHLRMINQTKLRSQKQDHFDVLEFSLGFPIIRLMYASNYYNSRIPLLLFELRDVLAALHDVSAHIKISMSLIIMAQYFKKQCSQWESFIEPFFISSLFSMLLYCIEPSSKLIISTTQMLNMNITRELASIVYQCDREMKMLRVFLSSNKSFSIEESPSRQVESVTNGHLIGNVCLVNHSGFNLAVTVSNRYSWISMDKTSYTVRNGSAVYTTLPVYPSFTQEPSRDDYRTKYYDAVVHCDNFQTARIPVFDEDTIVMKSIDNQALIARSQTSFGRKEILISGRVDMINHTGRDLYYSFDNPKDSLRRGIESPMEMLPKNCTVYAPVGVCTNGVISLASESIYSKFEESSITRLMISSIEKNGKELCASIGRGHLTIRIYITVTIVSSVPLIHIELLPGLKVHNLLATPMEFVVMDKSQTREGDMGIIQPLEYCYTYSVPIDLSSCVLEVRLPGEKAGLITKQIVSNLSGVLEFEHHVIRYSVSRDQDHSIVMEFYSDFWIINKTPDLLMIGNGQDRTQTIRQAEAHPICYDVSSDSSPPQEDYLPLMFSTIGSLLLKSNKSELIIYSSQYGVSRPFAAHIADFDGMIELRTRYGISQTYSVSVSFAPGDFEHTKVVTICPMYLMINNTDVPFYVQQVNVNRPPLLLKPHCPVIFNWSDMGSKHSIQVKHISRNSLWTSELILALGEQLALFEVPSGMTKLPDSEAVLRVFGATVNQQMVISFEFADAFSSKLFILKNTSELSSEGLHNLVHNTSEELQDRANGPNSQIHVLHDSLHSFSNRIKAENRRFRGILGVAPSDSSIISISIGIAGVTASFINKEYREVSYLAIEGINLSFEELSNKDMKLELSLTRLQMDNCIFGAQYPVVFGSPIHSPFFTADGSSTMSVRSMNALTSASESLVSGYHRTQSNQNHNNRLFHFVAHMPYNSNVVYIETLDVIIKDVELAVETSLLYEMFDLFRDLTPDNSDSLDDQTTQIQMQSLIQTHYPLPVLSSSRLFLFCDRLQIHPSKLTISFKSNAQYPVTDTLLRHLILPSFIRSIIDVAGNILGNVDRVQMFFREFDASDVYISAKDLFDKLILHYIVRSRLQLLRFVGAVNLLGNPIQLVNSLEQGIKAFFSEPIIGMKKGGKEFIEGVGKGTKELVSKTTYGLLNSVGKIVDTLGNGVETLSSSDSYKADRAAGKSGLIHGVKSGVNGLFTDLKNPKPNVVGSVVGMFTKPLGGLLDDTSDLIDKVKDMTNTEVYPSILRLPRCIGFDSCLQPYCLYTAIGMKYMQTLIQEETVGLTDKYVIHCPVNNGSLVLFFTLSHLLIINCKSNRVIWKEPYSAVNIYGTSSYCFISRKGTVGNKRNQDTPVNCEFNTATLFYLVQFFLRVSCKELDREGFMMFSDQVCICVQHYPIDKSATLREPKQSSPHSIPIEQVTLLQLREEKDGKISWKVQGCGYSWRAITTMHDIRFLHKAIFSSQEKPVGMTQNVSFDGGDKEILNELEEVLSTYKAILVSSYVEYILKKEYTEFKSLSVC